MIYDMKASDNEALYRVSTQNSEMLHFFLDLPLADTRVSLKVKRSCIKGPE